MTTNPGRVDVRLRAPELAIVADLQAALTSPLRPRVNASDVLRAGLHALHSNMVAAKVAA